MFMDLRYANEGAGLLPNHSSRKELSETISYMCFSHQLDDHTIGVAAHGTNRFYRDSTVVFIKQGASQ